MSSVKRGADEVQENFRQERYLKGVGRDEIQTNCLPTFTFGRRGLPSVPDDCLPFNETLDIKTKKLKTYLFVLI